MNHRQLRALFSAKEEPLRTHCIGVHKIASNKMISLYNVETG